MFGTHDLPLFIAAGLLLNMTPGADTLYIVGHSARQGLQAGIVAALGIGAGCIVHIVAAAAGISALLAASSTAFMLVKYAGAAYLFYLGFQLLLTKASAPTDKQALGIEPLTEPLARIFWQGFLTNALNPKVALFFLAFLPQFIAPQAESKWLSMLFLGIVFDVNGTLWNCFIAWSTHNVSRRLQGSQRLGQWLGRASGVLFIYFGVKLLLSNAQPVG